jgi:hypothetical protein
MVRSMRSTFCLIALSFLPLITACGVRESKLEESGATLTGTITYNGAQIEFAQVTVRGAKGENAIGIVGEDGKYKVENAPLGDVTIAVNTAAQQGAFTAKMMAQGAAAADPNAPKKRSDPKFVNVPEKYYEPEKSGLKTTIQKGENTFDIKVE